MLRPGLEYPWLAAAAMMAGVLALAFVGLALAPVPAPPKPEAEPVVEEVKPPPGPEVRAIEVERGDTLTGILTEQGVTSDEARAAVQSLSSVYDPTDIRAGQTITLTLAPEGMMLSLALKPSIERDLLVRRSEDGTFAIDDRVMTLTATDTRAAGMIDGSLFISAISAGVPEAVIVDLIHIYSYDVDFQREVKSGDRFDILYTSFVDEHGQPIKGGAIQYAELTLQGKAKPLYRFTTNDKASDYFTPKGISGKRQLMRTPIDGARLTSRYGMRRHPILGYTKMHKGVDFGAPTGTPVMASGNGTVKMAGWHGGYGRYVQLSHAGTYSTAYAHLSRFARGIKSGVRVRQGQIIGYVGTTGRSTGPHLHYEVLAKGKQINPMGVKLPTGRELTGKDLLAFQENVARVQTLLSTLPAGPALVAQARTTP
ncbi:MAG: peptidoglycan DD-metalloendopeptidase family protein [Alphaproteobacteria bacterium]|nr:peptidoglycan DD-metalloendopeptidase family protein [Alphaproteobacteria bacterium]